MASLTELEFSQTLFSVIRGLDFFGTHTTASVFTSICVLKQKNLIRLHIYLAFNKLSSIIT